LIARPISLNQIRNKANDGKFQNWAEFENEVLLIRKNAEEYNAEGSNIVIEARTLEVIVYVDLLWGECYADLR
jgi:hypothetical protein